MTYFLDFDRTLIDYESYLEYLTTLPEWSIFHNRLRAYKKRPDGTNDVSAEERAALFYDIDTWYSAGGYQFSPGQLKHLIYPDVFEFLSVHGASSVIVTAGRGELKYQRDKVTSSGVHSLVEDVVYLAEEAGEKGAVIKDMQNAYPAPYLLVDDKESQLRDVERMAPAVALYHMVRDHATRPSTRYPVVHSLAELP